LARLPHRSKSASRGIPAEIFTPEVWARVRASTRQKQKKCGQNRCLAFKGPMFSSLAAQGMQHMVVDGLHSIDSAVDRKGDFLLTLKMKGVKTNSFFDSF
jgi:hypothetical protein